MSLPSRDLLHPQERPPPPRSMHNKMQAHKHAYRKEVCMYACRNGRIIHVINHPSVAFNHILTVAIVCNNILLQRWKTSLACQRVRPTLPRKGSILRHGPPLGIQDPFWDLSATLKGSISLKFLLVKNTCKGVYDFQNFYQVQLRIDFSNIFRKCIYSSQNVWQLYLIKRFYQL
jgi:hypothetical protein